MKKQTFKRTASALLAFVTVLVMLPTFALPASAWSWKDDGKFEVASYNTPIVEDGTIEVDVELDSVYLSGTKITSYPDEEPYKRGNYSFSYTDEVCAAANANFIAYVAVDTTGMFVYAEIEDTTIFETTNTNGNDGDCLQIFFDWCPPEFVHPQPEELYDLYYLTGTGWDYASYRSKYLFDAVGLQYLGWLSADYNEVISSNGGFNPHTALGPDATDSVEYEAKLIDGGWACEWFIPWRDQEQKDMIANGEQFHCGIGFQSCDDSDIDNTCTPDKEENVGLRFDQRKELGLSYWADYSMLADLVFVDKCTNSSNHDYKTEKVISATCTEDGYTVKKCSVCGKTVNDDNVSKLGHNYIMGFCTECGKAYNVIRVESTKTLVGESFDVTVSTVMNEGVWSLAFELPIDPDVFEFVSADTSGSIFNQFAICEFDETDNTYKFNAYNSSLLNNILTNGELVTLTLKVKETALENECGLALEILDKQIINVDQEKVSFEAENGAVEVLDQILGDANGDGDITNADALVIFRYIYNPTLYPLPQPLAADANRDGDVTNSDVLLIFRYIFNPTLYPLSTVCRHTYGGWTVEKAATCTEDGTLVRTCGNCSKAEYRVLESEHAYGGLSGKEGTCLKCGNSYSVYEQIGIPEVNYGDAEVTIVHWDESNPEFSVTQETIYGDPIKEAVYLRNLDTERLLGVDLNFIHNQYSGNSVNQMNEWCNKLQNIMNDPSTPVDIFASYSKVLSAATLRGLNQDLNAYDNLDLNKKWWPSDVKEELSVDGKLYFVTGDISTNAILMMHTVFYNKTMAESYGLDDMIQLVKNNQWTIDKMIEYSSNGYDDLTNNGKTSDDKFGMTFTYWDAESLIQGADFKILDSANYETEGAYVKITDDFYSNAFDNFIGKISEWSASEYVLNEGDYSGDASRAFVDGRSIFHINAISLGGNLQEAGVDYGILPMPIRDPHQSIGYKTMLANPYTNYAMAKNCRNGERAAAVLATLGFCAYQYTTPAVFDEVFNSKFANDSDMIEMFDLIREGICFEKANLYTRELNNITDKPTLAILQNTEWSVAMDAFQKRKYNTFVYRLNNKFKGVVEA